MIIKKQVLLSLFILLTGIFLSGYNVAHSDQNTEDNSWVNNIPPRLQWNANSGYCGEVCLISAGLYYGQYISQYDARALACKNKKQTNCQLLVGQNDQYAASQMRLKSIEWNSNKQKSTNQFLSWVKKNVLKGYPVAIGVYTNEYLFYGDRNPLAGDPEYDHIVLVNGIRSNQPLSNSKYNKKDVLYFSDNGLWGDSSYRPYEFDYRFKDFQATRIQANSKHGPIYSLSDQTPNYGIAIVGVLDLNGDTLPVHIETSVNYEKPEIKNGSNERPAPEPLVLTITIDQLVPNTLYYLYRYDNVQNVPDSNFNAHAAAAIERFNILISSGTSYTFTQVINSNEMAIYRAVKATAP